MTNTELNLSNDYAVAKALNKSIGEIIILVLAGSLVGLEDEGIDDINKTYILLSDELEKLYSRNNKLEAIEPKPIWKTFDVLKTSTWDIAEYYEDNRNDFGQAHRARIERLSILTGIVEPNFSKHQIQLLDTARSAIAKYGKIIDSANKIRMKTNDENWKIPEYTLTYKPDGTILVNGIIKLKKVHAGSSTERLLEQALNSPHELFKPDLGKTARNLSTVISSAGFTPVLRQLFFPTVSNSKGIVFRPSVSREEADKEQIDTHSLDQMLKPFESQN